MDKYLELLYRNIIKADLYFVFAYNAAVDESSKQSKV